MADVDVSRQLREARVASGEDLTSLAKRIGVREEHLRAIEDGRFVDLPKGIYGRAAVRSFAQACGFDPLATLAACEPFLAPVDEPISALGRLHGVRRPSAAADGHHAAAALSPDGSTPATTPFPQQLLDAGRLLCAAAIDAVVVVLLLLALVGCAVTALMVPLSAIAHSGPAFGVMGALLGASYFGWLGGLRGATVGEQLLRPAGRTADAPLHRLEAIAARGMQSATRDASVILQLGASFGAWTLGKSSGEDAGIGHFEQPASR
jgi:hypothetical protein